MMLSLKSATAAHTAVIKAGLLDLPPELLRCTFDHVYVLDDLLAASLVSKGLREAMLPILYGSVNLTFTMRIRRNCETRLDFLLKTSHLQKYVREICIRPPFPGLNTEWLEFGKFERLLPCLKNLRFLR